MKEGEEKFFEVRLDPKDVATLEAVERGYMLAVIDLFGGNKTRAAKALGVARKTIYRKLGLNVDW